MLERQVTEGLWPAGKISVKAVVDGVSGQVPRFCVRGEGPPGAAKHISRKLIERDDERQAEFGRFSKMVQLASSRLFVNFGKLADELAVEIGGGPEPDLAFIKVRTHIG